MATQIVMDHTGDTRHTFDPTKSDELAAAMARFDELVKGEKKMIAYKRTAPGKGEHLRAFDPTAEETVFHRQMQGG